MSACYFEVCNKSWPMMPYVLVLYCMWNLEACFTGVSSSHTTAGYVLLLEVMHDLSKKMWSFLDTKCHQEYVACVCLVNSKVMNLFL